ncbi:dehydrogenase/reductase SDR family member 1 isoform X2 [Rhincodon typus]|uniref:dehydrogenase/reductase SDR family member 1 isoform X2 n=1 Tax=Rhincodon typus TaxID=259920 RepID=UPI00202F1F1D|nr:dehydrogenase/reductase SDR family member 1 isoform X2 [Rhincodon typus]
MSVPSLGPFEPRATHPRPAHPCSDWSVRRSGGAAIGCRPRAVGPASLGKVLEGRQRPPFCELERERSDREVKIFGALLEAKGVNCLPLADMACALLGNVCIVTGASRGIGKGIALQLAEAGATVYITGRNMDTLQTTAKEVEGRGGRCVPVVCDSSSEEQVCSLFSQVKQEQGGRLDVLVNNAYGGVQAILNSQGKKFWEMPASFWDDINNVGLRGHYICSVYAAQMMVEAKRGLIVIISSMGGLRYMFNVAYGVGKAACDRMAADCAEELRRHGVSYISLWPGAVRTETVTDLIINRTAKTKGEQKTVEMFANGETPEMSGKCIVALATDKNLMKKSGKVLLTCDLAAQYGLRDVDGRALVDYRSLKFLLQQLPGLSWLATLTPGFIKVPKWVLTLAGSKF